jgi:hypothetical protein
VGVSEDPEAHSTRLCVFYVLGVSYYREGVLERVGGLSFPPYCLTEEFRQYSHNVLLNANEITSATLAHEVTHCLADLPDENRPWNLLFGRPYNLPKELGGELPCNGFYNWRWRALRLDTNQEGRIYGDTGHVR